MTPDPDKARAAFRSLHSVIVFSPRDYAADPDDAWIYGIVVGWNNSLDEVAEQHKWEPEEVDRLRSMRATVAKILGEES